MKSSDDLTTEQLLQMDFVDNTIFNMLKEITGCPDLEWDIRVISEIRETIIKEYYPNDEYEFYPWTEVEEEYNVLGEFSIHDIVKVTPANGDDFHEFVGRIDGTRYEYVIVVDGEGDSYDVHKWQLEKYFK